MHSTGAGKFPTTRARPGRCSGQSTTRARKAELFSSDSLQLWPRALVHHITSVERRLRFEQYHVCLQIGDRKVFDTVRDNDILARLYSQFAFLTLLADLHSQRSVDDQEKLIFQFVLMPDEFSAELDQLHIGLVDFTSDARRPAIGERRELFGEVYNSNRLHA